MTAVLVRGGSFRAIYHENLDRTFRRHELQSELLFKSGEKVRERRNWRSSEALRQSGQGIIGAEVQDEIEFAVEACPIEDGPVQCERQLAEKVRYVDLVAAHP